jgi:hypothetical protein
MKEIGLVCVLFILACTVPVSDDGEGGSTSSMGGTAGSGGDAMGGSHDHGGGGSDATGGAGGTPSDGGGAGGDTPAAFFSCADVPEEGAFYVKVHAPGMAADHSLRMAYSVDYPPGTYDDIALSWNPPALKTGEKGVQDVVFKDWGSTVEGMVLRSTLGSTYDGVPATDNDGILDGSYFCELQNGSPTCWIDILFCNGTEEIGQYEDGIGSGCFAFMDGRPNPGCVVP